MPSMKTATCGSVIAPAPVAAGSAASGPSQRHLALVLLDQHLLELLDVLELARPGAGADADDAAEDLRHPLQEDQHPRDHDHGLELEDRDVRRAHGADLEVAPRAVRVLPAGEDQREDARKEEEEVEHQLDHRLGARLPQPVDEVGAHVPVLRQRVGARHHEERAVHDVGDVERPGGRGAQRVADEDLVADPEGHQQDQPREGVAEPGRELVGELDVSLHRTPRSASRRSTRGDAVGVAPRNRLDRQVRA